MAKTKPQKTTDRPASKPRSQSKPRRTTRQATPPPPPERKGLSLDRKLDILGVGMTLVGFLTLLSLFSSQRGWLTSGWITAIGRVFGWGMYLFPLGLLGLGLWLILRHFDRLPHPALEQVAGAILLFVNALVWLHFVEFPADRSAGFALAAAGRGGGYLGGILLSLLQAGLGWGGAAVALLAWLVLALAVTLDVSVLELFDWIPPLMRRLTEFWIGNRPRKKWTTPESAPLALRSPPTPRMGGPPVGADSASRPSPIAPPSLPTEGEGIRQWILPPLEEILDKGGEINYDDEIDRQRARVIEETLTSFGAPAQVVEINRGPTITQFGVEPGFTESRNGQMRVRVGKIAALADDLALALSAKRIRIQAPVPSKGFVGIEVPNEEISLVALRDVIESEAFRRNKSPLRFALGLDVAGAAVAADLAAMPHLLIAGATGSGKSVCVNSLICCLLLNNTPDDLRMVMVDPKRVELTGYNGIPHLLAPVVVELERVVGALQWVSREMDMRYHKLAQLGARNINDYNARMAARNEKKLPHLVVVIDELADLMMLAPDETERTITRLAQLARATGIHLVIATQRPSVDVVTGLIKANFPARVAFAVASGVDSRVILDQMGAERLLGRGDMLFQAPDAAAPARLQGVFVSEVEIQRLVYYWQALASSMKSPVVVSDSFVDALPAGIPLVQMPLWEDMQPAEAIDPLYNEAVDLSRRQGRASITMLQRRLRIGYTRAARLIELMQEKRVIGTESSPQGFEVLDYGPAAPPIEEQGD